MVSSIKCSRCGCEGIHACLGEHYDRSGTDEDSILVALDYPGLRNLREFGSICNVDARSKEHEDRGRTRRSLRKVRQRRS